MYKTKEDEKPKIEQLLIKVAYTKGFEYTRLTRSFKEQCKEGREKIYRFSLRNEKTKKTTYHWSYWDMWQELDKHFVIREELKKEDEVKEEQPKEMELV